MNSYTQDVLNQIQKRVPWEKEFIQSVAEVFESIGPVLDAEPSYKKFKILERITEPERTISFRVPWEDDRGEIQVNRGYRVQFNSTLGPYKGGLRFHSSVNLSILKFLGFEQVFKNALTGLPMGGGKGGSDFNFRGRSDTEVMRFCQSFMSELYRHIGADLDVPAGDIGVGAREIGYLFGQYKRLKNVFEGVLTGKGFNWGGSQLRPEATGFGVTYFADRLLASINQKMDGKTATVSGFGNVSWGVVKKVNELGGRVVTLSGPDGFVYDQDGIRGEKIEYMLEMRRSGRDSVKDYADKYKVSFYPGKRPWGIKCDLAFPCACENELGDADAKELVKNGCLAVVEGANLPTTLEAMKILHDNKIYHAPGKASNAGGVACSGLEMSQNSMRTFWTREDVDKRLHEIMYTIHDNCLATAKEYGKGHDYVFGANVTGFKKVVSAMIDQGLV
jgi:glutamate dehydrogenase (NADP+)